MSQGVCFKEANSDVLILFLTDCKFLKCGSAMKISGPDALTVTQQKDSNWGLATGNVVVGEEGGLTRAYFELRIDSGSSANGSLSLFCIGAVREGLNHDTYHYNSNNAWFLNMDYGGLDGNGKNNSDKQGEGSIKVGDRVGVLIDTEGEGRVLFFKNGEQFGPGFVGDVSGRLVLGVQMGNKGCQCTLLPDAKEPAEPFTKWAA